jgi:hypothetical protein
MAELVNTVLLSFGVLEPTGTASFGAIDMIFNAVGTRKLSFKTVAGVCLTQGSLSPNNLVRIVSAAYILSWV